MGLRETLPPSVVTYRSSKAFSTYRRMREVLPTAASPMRQTFVLKTPATSTRIGEWESISTLVPRYHDGEATRLEMRIRVLRDLSHDLGELEPVLEDQRVVGGIVPRAAHLRDPQLSLHSEFALLCQRKWVMASPREPSLCFRDEFGGGGGA